MLKYLLFTLVICSGCSEVKISEENVLECILYSAMSQLGEQESYLILASELQDYTDSITLISISFPKKELTIISDEVYEAEFNGTRMYFYSAPGYFNKKPLGYYPDFDEIKILKSSNLKFKKKEILLNPDLMMPPYSPPEIQFEYNLFENCIESILLIRWLDGKRIIDQCNSCNV